MFFKVFVNYGYTDEQLIGESNSRIEARNIAEEYAVDPAYNRVEVISFADDGEALTHYVYD